MTERGRGRPPVGPRVTIRLEPALLEQIDAAAKRLGVSRAEAIRFALGRYVEEIDPEWLRIVDEEDP